MLCAKNIFENLSFLSALIVMLFSIFYSIKTTEHSAMPYSVALVKNYFTVSFFVVSATFEIESTIGAATFVLSVAISSDPK